MTPFIAPVPPVLVSVQMPDERLWEALRDERNGVPGASERVDAALSRLAARYEGDEL